jgi:hypothetical protein
VLKFGAIYLSLLYVVLGLAGALIADRRARAV